MPKKKYNSDSLYFTDRKAYYKQKSLGNREELSQSREPSHYEVFSNKENLEKGIGMVAGSPGRDGFLGRSLDSALGLDSKLTARFPNLIGQGTLYRRYADGYIGIQEVVYLCQKAWEEFQLFRNTIETMVEFSASDIQISEKNASAKSFCEGWLNAVNMKGFSEQFYRELYRSCNLFIYKINGDIDKKDLKSLKDLSGGEVSIPVKYTILNPAQVALEGGVTYDAAVYKILSPYEIQRLKNPKSETEKSIFKNLDKDIQLQIQNHSENYGGSSETLRVALKDVDSIFYQKQDYEYFAVPLFYGVLDDIELKLEMKNADRQIIHSLDSMLLLLTMGGAKSRDGGELPPNPEHMAYMKTLFNNKKAQRVLVADYTTKAEYVIPDIDKIIGKNKYEQVNEDIREGLQTVFGGNETFSNSVTKVKIFCERLEKGQSIFKKWLEDQLHEVCKKMGFSARPKVKLSKISLEDDAQMFRVYTRMAELGFLTPEELFNATKTGVLPNMNESVKSQRQFKKQKEEDIYFPQIYNNSSYNPLDAESAVDEENVEPSANQKGRPPAKDSGFNEVRTRRVGSVEQLSLKSLKDVLNKFDNLKENVNKAFVEKYKVDKLTDGQKEITKSIALNISKNYELNDWESAVSKTVKDKNIFLNEEMQSSIDKICEDFEISDEFLGILVHHSK